VTFELAVPNDGSAATVNLTSATIDVIGLDSFVAVILGSSLQGGPPSLSE
jgi:hypothetical protein